MMLPVKTAYLSLIASGRKTSTIRAWEQCRVKPGQRLTFTNYRTSVRVQVLTVSCVRVEQLTRDDAVSDGFASLRELIEALRSHYPTLRPDARVWVIRFELANDSSQSARATA